MNSLTHFLFASNILLSLFNENIATKVVFLFAFIFGVMIDSDVFIRMGLLRHKQSITRTWLQEPFGLCIIGGNLAVLLQAIYGSPYALLVLIPYTSHVLLDYISIHQVRPFDPFSKKVFSVGWIQTRLLNKRDLRNWTGLNENYFMLANVFFFIMFMVVK